MLNSKQGQGRRIDRFTDISIHPLYNGKTSSKYDAAVIKLRSSVIGPPIMLARLGSNRLDHAGREVTIVGWGNMGGLVRERLRREPLPRREAGPPLVSDAACEGANKGDFTASLKVCVGEKEVDTCQGDSGGPVWATTNAGQRQIGITSFGYGCATAHYPGLYTELNAPCIRSFIRQAAGR